MINKYLSSILFLTAFSFCTLIYGQILPFQNYSIKEGLISINIHSLCEDSLGYIWIGTEEGISVFNSREFSSYTIANGLSSNNINCITADSRIKGRVWVGTEGHGVDVFENGRFRSYFNKLPHGMKSINVLVDDRNGLWCGSDGGLFCISHDSVRFFKETFSLGSIYALLKTKGNNFWIGSEKGLFVFNYKTNRVSAVNPGRSAANRNISCLLNLDGYIWAASESGMLYKLNTGGEPVYSFNLKQPVFSLGADNSGNIWIGTGRGLYKINNAGRSGNNIKRVNMGNQSDEDIITAILVDKENILWCGSNANGLSKLVYQNFFRIPIPTGQTTHYWSSTASDKNNHFWVSLKNKLMELWQDKNLLWHWREHKIDNSSDPLPVQRVACYDGNNLYVSYLKGIIKIYRIINDDAQSDGSKLRLLKEIKMPEPPKFYGLYTFLKDSKGMLWCSLLDAGVAVLNMDNDRLVKYYDSNTGLPDNSVRAIFEDKDGNYWFGGYDKGLSEFSKGKVYHDMYGKETGKIFVKHFSVKNGLPDNHIRSIVENKQNEIVIGTRYGGIAYLTNDSIKSIDRDNGLISNGVWEITKDPGNNLWFSSQTGIQEINNKNEIINFLLIDDIPRIPYYSICASQDGDICFSNNSNIYVYRPMDDPEDPPPLPVYIDGIMVNGKERKLKNFFSLPSFNNTVTFDFICITNRDEKNIRYMYRLHNVDNKWATVKGKPSVTFASLRPGHYSFQVIAEDSRSFNSRRPAEIDFIIDAPFYLHWWFIGFILATVILTIVSISKARFNRLLEIEKIRTRIAADLHDEIGSGLTRIAILSEHALQEEKKQYEPPDKNDEKYSKYVSMERVGKISRNLVDSMIDVIWSIDPKYDSLNDFIFNFKTFANEVCEAKNIKLEIGTEDIENVKVNAQIKRSLQLISKEALNNALKYSGCSNVKYSLSVKNKNIHLLVEDDGTGFDHDKVKYGHGLVNIKKHVKELSGTCIIDTFPGRGTKISILFPVKS